MPESLTSYHELKKYDTGDNPGAANLNSNLDRIDKDLVGWGAAFPSTYPLGKLFLRTDEGKYYENTGTLEVPVWTFLTGGSGGGSGCWKSKVRVATTAAGTFATSFAAGQTVDSTILAEGDRILIKNQASTLENGIYDVQAAGAPVRAEDANTTELLDGAVVMVGEGGVNSDTIWLQLTDNPTVETSPIIWSALASAATVSALAALIVAKADQSQVDTIQTTVNDHETRIDDLEADVTDLNTNAILKDGSVAMEADLDLGNFKVKNLANGTIATDAVNKGQLEAAIAAGLGSLGVYTYARAHASADLSLGASPRTFEADTNDNVTDAAMHSTSSNPDRFVAQQDGYYLFEARLKVQGFGGCGVQWYKNGSLVTEGIQPQFLAAQGTNITFIVTQLLVPLDETDYIVAKVYGLAEPDSGKILQDSAVSMFLLSANGVGGGDFLANGDVPMTDDLDFGGNKGINAADATNPTDLTTLQQVEVLVDAEEAARIAADSDLQDQIDGLVTPATPTLEAPEVEVTSGNFSFGAAWSEFTQSRLEFTLAGSTRVIMEDEGTAIPNFIAQSDAQMGIRLQKLTGPGGSPDGAAEDFYGTYTSLGPYGYGLIGTIRCMKRKTLVAATWRVSIICRKPNGAANSSGLYATADIPARIGVTYLS